MKARQLAGISRKQRRAWGNLVLPIYFKAAICNLKRARAN